MPSAVSSDDMLSRHFGDSENLDGVDWVCPERSTGAPDTSSKSLPYNNDLEVVGTAIRPAPAALARSGTAPLPGTLRNPSHPPQ